MGTRTVDLPPLPLTGGCQCGAVRYRLTGRPVTFYHCHCTECQKQSASAHGQSLRMRRADVVVDGTMAAFERPSASGHHLKGWFCPSCGNRILHERAGADAVNIKAGTLDNTSWLRPAGHIWTRSAQAGTRFDAEDPVWAKQPDDNYQALIRQWSLMLEDDETR